MQSFNEYQQFTKKLASYNTDVYLNTGRSTDEYEFEHQEDLPYLYPLLALAEEAGEVCGKVAKYVRKSRQETDYNKLRADVGKELGDLLYQVSETARQLGYSLQDIVDMNVAKLEDRAERGVLVGEGDDR